MKKPPKIHLFVSDPAVLSSLKFALSVEGFKPVDGSAAGCTASSAQAVVIDRSSFSEGANTSSWLRSSGCAAPIILLATNPTRQNRARAAIEGILIIEKPLLGDELSRALLAALNLEKAA